MQEYTLHAYFRSSCSARLRILLHLKDIPYQLQTVNLLQDQHLSDQHRALNPSASVPLLVCPAPDRRDQDHDHDQDQDHDREHAPGFCIGQSLAAMEYLEETHPAVPVLPPRSQPRTRALVRVLCCIIAADTQPVTNLRITRRVRALGGDADDWNRALMDEGLRAYEAVARDSAGRYSVGDLITMADACLMPAVWNARRVGIDVCSAASASDFPTIARVVRNLSEHPAVKAAEYFRQPDCPDHLRQQAVGEEGE
ncbi:hypothetical protein E4U42_006680 [Claviceps africana]|uniref:Maleylacetoacetate isomerase n=1 Tax=Claviceps africana TaxID=83212 RepID=A0A8K0NNR2_9HYPO|nr:hypothetical protein E4U42_006680 [Claviceps africana]